LYFLRVLLFTVAGLYLSGREIGEKKVLLQKSGFNGGGKMGIYLTYKYLVY
jgi:hypothetical protein